jgi:site-specific DNA recombinase
MPRGGRPPYGYRMCVDDCGTRALEPDPATAHVVTRIFASYLNGDGLQTIAAGLTAENIAKPSSHDALRNPHHNGSAWSKGVVRAIIVNPRYVGSPGDAGGQGAYRGLVTADMFDEVQRLLGERGSNTAPERAGSHAFRGVIRCGLCRRLMQGTWNNDTPYYRCRVYRETADENQQDHPANVYLQQSRILRPIQRWLVTEASARPIRDWIHRQLTGPSRRPAKPLWALQRVRLLDSLGPESRTAVFQDLNFRLLYLPDERVIHIRASLLPGAITEGAIPV